MVRLDFYMLYNNKTNGKVGETLSSFHFVRKPLELRFFGSEHVRSALATFIYRQGENGYRLLSAHILIT